MCPNLWLVVYTVCTINYKSGCTQLQCCINCFFFFFFETPRSFRSIVPHRSLVALVCVMIIIFKNNNTIFFFFFSGKNFIAVFPVLFSAEDRLQGRGERAPRTGHGSGGFPAVRVSLPGPPAQDVGGETPRQDEPGPRLPPPSPPPPPLPPPPSTPPSLLSHWSLPSLLPGLHVGLLSGVRRRPQFGVRGGRHHAGHIRVHEGRTSEVGSEDRHAGSPDAGRQHQSQHRFVWHRLDF